MRNVRWITIALLLCAAFNRAEAEDYKSTMLKKGLPAKITVTVKDQDDKPVQDATVMFCFVLNNIEEPNTVTVKTDANGMATGEANANRCVVLHLTKEGYYRSFVEYGLWGSGKGYETGRWEPWNPTVEVVLREKKCPQRNYRRGSETAYHLAKEGLYGFDLLANKVVEPGSKDGHADFYFSGTGSYYDRDMKIKGDWEKRDVFMFNFPEDGFITMKRNKDSDFAFAYEAPLVGYENHVEFYLSRADTENRKPYPSDSTEFTVFRVSRKNAETGEVDSYYGIIESFGYKKDWNNGDPWFSIRYRINREPDDRNIEY